MISVPERVKDALREGNMPKNYRFNVLNDDGTTNFTIDNDSLIAESVKFDERMCTGDTLKFGLCEGTSLEFQYFNHPNINGRQIQGFIDVSYRDDVNTYTNVTQFEKFVLVEIEAAGKYRVFCADANGFDYVYLTRSEDVTQYTPIVDESGTYVFLTCQVGDKIEVEWDGWEITDTFLQSYVTEEETLTYTIPMGFYTVEKCPVQMATGIRKVTAYNKLMSKYLDQKANNILLELNGGDATKVLSVYDIQTQLLDAYSITEREENIYPFPDATPNTRRIAFIDNATIGSKYRLYGGDTPFSSYRLFQLTGLNYLNCYSKNCRLYDSYHQAEIYTNTEYWYLDFIKGDIDTFSQNLHDCIFDMWENAFLSPYTPESSFNSSYKFDITIMLYNEQNHQYEFWKQYFFLGKKKREIIDGTYTYIDQTPSDFMAEINETLHKGKAKITINLIKKMDFGSDYYDGSREVNNPPTSDENFIANFYGEPFEYSYYASSGYDGSHVYPTDLTTKIYNPIVRFSNGDIYNASTTFSDLFQIREAILTDAEQIEFTIGDIPEFTLRDLIGADFEIECQYGKLDRQIDLFAGIELNQAALYPRENLYPADDLYPGGLMERTIKTAYNKLWTDSGGIQSFKYLIITYKTIENDEEVEKTLQRTVNANGTTNYNMSDNWLFRNLTWNAADIGAYADAMVEKMRNITWFPFELWGAGLPYIEAGDKIEIVTSEGTYTSYILNRQLKGIQNLEDNYINGTLEVF